jgi:hypothetical protein
LGTIKASMAYFGSGPPLQPESWRVRQNSGAAMMVTSFILVLKKLQRPMNDLIVLILMGSFVSLMTFSLFFPNLMPLGVRVNTRF